jgi:hypothetical protein
MADLRDIRITILGKFGHIAGLHSGVYLIERAREWQIPLRILADYDQADCSLVRTDTTARRIWSL